jgi:hypothetical protein
MKRYLFICGCARSGTSPLVWLLDSHRHIAIGMERYLRRVLSGDGLTPELFEKDRFFSVEKGDTFYQSLEFRKSLYDSLRKKWQSSLVVGDKIPKLYTQYERIFESFPDARVIFISRNLIDVANSYKRRAEDPSDDLWPQTRGVLAAIDDWNTANSLTLAAMTRYPGKIYIVSHESLFLERKGLEELFGFVGVEPGKSVLTHFERNQSKSAKVSARRTELLSESEKLAICIRADMESFGKLYELTAVPPSTALRLSIEPGQTAGDSRKKKLPGKGHTAEHAPPVASVGVAGTQGPNS